MVSGDIVYGQWRHYAFVRTANAGYQWNPSTSGMTYHPAGYTYFYNHGVKTIPTSGTGPTNLICGGTANASPPTYCGITYGNNWVKIDEFCVRNGAIWMYDFTPPSSPYEGSPC